jgi:hypothetical protein
MSDEFDEGIDALTTLMTVQVLVEEILDKHREIARAAPNKPIAELHKKVAGSMHAILDGVGKLLTVPSIAERRAFLDDAIAQAVVLTNALVTIDEELAKQQPAPEVTP